MNIIVDAQNYISSLSDAPDRLRAEIGLHYSSDANFASSFKNYNFGIKYSSREMFIKENIVNLERNNQMLIPTMKSRIFLSGRENRFRDHDQWRDYVGATIKTGTTFLDHQFYLHNFMKNEGKIIKNFHLPTYEDLTKTNPSNQLLNWNLISYPFKDRKENVSRIGDLRTPFDSSNYIVGTEGFKVENLIDKYQTRIENYVGSVSEISVKQRNIFDLQRDSDMSQMSLMPKRPKVPISKFPFYFHKHLDNRKFNIWISQILDGFGKTKFILQAIKDDVASSTAQFRTEQGNTPAKLYNLVDLITSTRIVQFKEREDEIFLTTGAETDDGDPSNRFVNSINTGKFLARMRVYIGAKMRTYGDVVSANSCETFFIAYKIEKYLDNDATRPVQTYYTNDLEFIDTQIKYGRKYIYKTKALIGIVGSQYSYSDLYVSSQDGINMEGPGGVVTDVPDGYASISSEKYRAYVDVEVRPSFQVLEYQIDEDEVIFVDDKPNMPQVDFSYQPNKPDVGFFLTPMYEDREGVDDRLRMEYFSGVYEIYKLDKPPMSMRDFEDGFLASVDDKTTLTNLPESMKDIPDFSVESMSGFYVDRLVPNQKYYYAFKSVTYHGTKSEFTLPFEIEMVQDSDEYKVVVREYKIPTEKEYVFEDKMKRIMRISPNIERLLFSLEENTKVWKLDEGSMLEKGQTTKFKIRVTSKHTGKKVDINLNFFLDDRT